MPDPEVSPDLEALIRPDISGSCLTSSSLESSILNMVHQHVDKPKSFSFSPSNIVPGQWMISSSLEISPAGICPGFKVCCHIGLIIPIFSKREFSYLDSISTFVEHILSSTWQEIWCSKELILLHWTDLRIFNKNSPKSSCPDMDGIGCVCFRLS